MVHTGKDKEVYEQEDQSCPGEVAEVLVVFAVEYRFHLCLRKLVDMAL